MWWSLTQVRLKKEVASVVIQDQGTEFVNEITDELCTMLNTEKGIAQ